MEDSVPQQRAGLRIVAAEMDDSVWRGFAAASKFLDMGDFDNAQFGLAEEGVHRDELGGGRPANAP